MKISNTRTDIEIGLYIKFFKRVCSLLPGKVVAINLVINR